MVLSLLKRAVVLFAIASPVNQSFWERVLLILNGWFFCNKIIRCWSVPIHWKSQSSAKKWKALNTNKCLKNLTELEPTAYGLTADGFTIKLLRTPPFKNFDFILNIHATVIKLSGPDNFYISYTYCNNTLKGYGIREVWTSSCETKAIGLNTWVLFVYLKRIIQPKLFYLLDSQTTLQRSLRQQIIVSSL
jgi:hypothetical protein